jgi:preprotein translocase subunit SecE
MPEVEFTAPDFGGNLIEYFKQVKSELKKVEWPTKKQVVKSTSLVLTISILVGTFLGGLDLIFTKIFALLLK